MKELKMATFTFSVPLTFKFNAQRDTDNKTLWKMAESYLDLAIKFGDYDLKENMLNLISEVKVLTEEEKEEKRKDDELFETIKRINQGGKTNDLYVRKDR